MPTNQVNTQKIILTVQDLSIGFLADDGSGNAGQATRQVSFDLYAGRCLCLVGESGCGKSVTALGLARLLNTPPAVYLSGRVLLEGQDILTMTGKEMSQVRGQRIAMIFQDPMTSLNPVMRIGEQIAEALILHKGLSKKQAMEKVHELLDMVGIPKPAERAKYFPHQMSGGMRQRVMIAMALACEPEIIIADEPTTALDVTIQRQILELLKALVQKTEASLLLITHDFTVVEQIADEVAVMYAGSIVEQGSALDILQNPSHPYTKGLLGSRPSQNFTEMLTEKGTADIANLSVANAPHKKRERLEAITGTVPSIWQKIQGCPFEPRCKIAEKVCKNQYPDLKPPVQNLKLEQSKHLCRCWLA